MSKMKMRGLAMPIEMIVIIAIAVLVLVVISAFFVGGTGRLGAVGDASAFGAGCNDLRLQNCAVSAASIQIKDYAEPARGNLAEGFAPRGSLLRACDNLGRIPFNDQNPESACRRACGCPS